MKNLFITLLGFTHADSPGVYTSDTILILGTINRIHLKCDVIDGSVVRRIREPILSSFTLDKPGSYKVYCDPEKIHYEKINKSVLNTILLCLEGHNHEEVSFKGKSITFAIQLIKI